MTTPNHAMHNLPKHYHIEGRVDDDRGGMADYRTPAIPQGQAHRDIAAIAGERQLRRLSSGAYGDPERQGEYLVLMPCMRSTEESYFSVQGWLTLGGPGGEQVVQEGEVTA